MLLAANLCRIQNIFVRKSMMGSIVSMIIFGDNPQNLGFTNYPVVGKTLAIEKTPFFAYFCMAFRVFHGTSPIETRDFRDFPIPLVFCTKENFSQNLASVRDEMMPQLMKEPGKNHGKTMGKPTRNAHKKDIKSNPEGLQGLQLRTLTFSI
jgi:hypothetical protein